MNKARPPILLVLAVLLAHLGGREGVSRLQDGWVQDEQAPPRMQAAFVRELQPVVLPAASPAPARPKPPAGTERRTAALAPELPASSPPPLPREALAKAAEPAVSVQAVTEPIAALEMPAAAQDVEPGPEWPLSTRLEFDLSGNYRGPIYGDARVEWLRKGASYQMHLETSVGPSFAPLLRRRASSYGELTAEGIRPQRYEEETRVALGSPRRLNVLFQGDRVQLANGNNEPLLPGAQDQASQFVQLTWLFLTQRLRPEPGFAVDQPLVLARKQYAWRYVVLGQEDVDTPMGQLPTWHLKPQREVGGGDLTAEVWLAPSVQFLPVRMLLRQDADTWIELTLKSAPLQAAPESAASQPRKLP